MKNANTTDNKFCIKPDDKSIAHEIETIQVTSYREQTSIS